MSSQQWSDVVDDSLTTKRHIIKLPTLQNGSQLFHNWSMILKFTLIQYKIRYDFNVLLSNIKQHIPLITTDKEKMISLSPEEKRWYSLKLL